jgi:uncharacterized membrane protein YkoI
MRFLNVMALFSFLVFLGACNCENRKLTEEQVPQAVKDGFFAHHQQASTLQTAWELEGDFYSVEFDVDGFRKEMAFDESGTLIFTETEVSVDVLPSAILEYVDANYKNYDYKEIELVQKPGEAVFKIEILVEDKEIELIFDTVGRFIGEEKDEDADKESNDK